MNSLESFAKIIPNTSTSPVLSNHILTDVETKARNVINGLNSSVYENSNEPSIALYRIQVLKDSFFLIFILDNLGTCTQNFTNCGR